MKQTTFPGFFCPTRILMGENSHVQIPEILTDFGCDKVLLVIDHAILETPVSQFLQASAKTAGIGFSIFSDIEPDPSDTTVAKAFEVAQEMGVKGVVALGGGSAIDVAKAVCILATNGGRIHDYEGIEVFSIPPLPLAAIPSTAGTGSEVSGSCVITDTERHLKMSIRHASLNPARIAILDPVVLETLPAHVAVHSGMDAFVHAFESYISSKANAFTDALNLRAIELISQNIGPFSANRRNHEAAQNMLVGSTLAGMSFGITGLGNVHCLARFIGAFYGVSHGLSNALCLHRVAAYNRLAHPIKFARIASAMGENTEGLTVDQASLLAVDAIGRLCDALSVPKKLREVGAQVEDFDRIAELCVEANYNRWNPRLSTKADFLQLLHENY